jgi:hypothetical protein
MSQRGIAIMLTIKRVPPVETPRTKCARSLPTSNLTHNEWRCQFHREAKGPLERCRHKSPPNRLHLAQFEEDDFSIPTSTRINVLLTSAQPRHQAMSELSSIVPGNQQHAFLCHKPVAALSESYSGELSHAATHRRIPPCHRSFQSITRNSGGRSLSTS